MKNLYIPELMRIADIIEETPDTKTFNLVFDDEARRESFNFSVGQFGLFSAFGTGESTFNISSPANRRGYIECTFRIVGRVTAALGDLNIGDKVGFRGPYGNYFPMEQYEGKNLIFIAGGIGLPPVRCVIWECLDRREKYKDITIVYGARSEADLVYKQEIAHWDERPDIKMVKTVDPGGASEKWDGKVGYVPAILEEMAPSPEDAYAFICGPPIMIQYAIASLKKSGFTDEQIFTTLENKMKCGVGKCGRCNIGDLYICKEGPVYTAAQVNQMYPDF